MSRVLLVLVAFGLLCSLPAAADENRPGYPVTKQEDTYAYLHGQSYADPYQWLEDDDREDVITWDKAQNDLLRARLDAAPRREELGRALTGEFGLGGMKSLPTFEGGMRWYTYRASAENHAILYRTDETGMQSPTQVLNPNGWSDGGTAGLKAWHVSPDGRYVAYRRDDQGSEETTLYVLDANTGELLPESIDRTKFSSVVWLEDSTGFFYNRMPDAGSVPQGESQYHARIYFHKLGTLVLDDPMVYGRGRPMLESCWLYRSADRKQLFLGRGLPYKAVETFEATWNEGALSLRSVLEGVEHRTWIDKVGDTYILNSDRNTGRREVLTAKRDAAGALGPWTAVAYPRTDKGVVQDAVVVGNRYIVCHMRDDLVSRLYVRPIAGGDVREIVLPGDGSIGREIATKDDDTNIWFTFESYNQPPTTYRCDVAAEKFVLEAEDTLPTSVKAENLVSTRVMVPSKDGTEIPVYLLHRKDTKLDGSAPGILYGYGGFRVGLYPLYSRTRALWAELGGIYAVASLRGGDEYGEDWHQAGSMGNKQNVFDDFIACADWLVASKKVSRGRLAIQGGSNGGLLVATCLNQRPDLCRAAICGVPLTDMLRFHLFQYARSWTKEYGDPDVPEHCAWIAPYSPYHNVQPAQAFPAVLVTAGLRDGRVNAFHARKIVARWQERTISTHPILLRIDREGGHGAADLQRMVQGILDEWCFLFQELDGTM
ncbi:MAG: prolyl oligopeptidase family serine peptidase [Planctomycetota bacterium]|nr:prolyl oligopeptidase family serine peptidase [Planctomycetota bacterium]